MRNFTLGERLKTCASLVREGAVLADVGTDHAYLPIYLLSEGKIERAVLSDINEGPLLKAKENVIANGYSERVSLVLCDGACALAESGATDYSVCGMGGELIASIISSAPHLKDKKIRLILQPMSKPEALRSFLFDNGFSILEERYSFDEGKYYVSMLAEYSGKKEEYTSFDACFGKTFPSDDNVRVMTEYMKRRKRALKGIINGKREGNADFSEEERLVAELSERFNI